MTRYGTSVLSRVALSGAASCVLSTDVSLARYKGHHSFLRAKKENEYVRRLNGRFFVDAGCWCRHGYNHWQSPHGRAQHWRRVLQLQFHDPGSTGRRFSVWTRYAQAASGLQSHSRTSVNQQLSRVHACMYWYLLASSCLIRVCCCALLL